jgi:hypothetical protein
VKAHWAYTEIIGAHSSPAYARYAGVDALRAKRGATVPFGALSEPERAALVVAWHGVRAHYFERYFATVLGYRVAHWTRPQLLSVRVPPRLDTTQSHYPTLLHFFSTQADHPDDPRNAEKEGIQSSRMANRSFSASTTLSPSSETGCTARGHSRCLPCPRQSKPMFRCRSSEAALAQFPAPTSLLPKMKLPGARPGALSRKR